jgi:myosin heavy subunit
MEALETAAELIGIDSEELQQSLLSRVMQTSKGGHKVILYFSI